jgi:hypothetical protein
MAGVPPRRLYRGPCRSHIEEARPAGRRLHPHQSEPTTACALRTFHSRSAKHWGIDTASSGIFAGRGRSAPGPDGEILFTRRERPQLRAIVVLNWFAELDARRSP